MPIRARWALAGAAGCSVLLFATWFGAIHLGPVARADQWAYESFTRLQQRGGVSAVTNFFTGLCDLGPYLFLAAGVVLVALLRRRSRVALAIGVLLVGANVTTEILKPLLAHPRPASMLYPIVPPGSWPSGHTTAAMALALGLVLAVPARLRPAVAAAGAMFAVAVGYSLVVAGSHYPSDVVGGLLVPAIWTLLVVAALIMAEHRWPTTRAHPPRVSVQAALGPSAAVLIFLVALVVMIGLIQPHSTVDYARAHASAVVAAISIAALSLAVSTGVMLAVRR